MLPDLSSEQHCLLTPDPGCDLQDEVAQICLLLRDQQIKDLIGEAGGCDKKVNKTDVMREEQQTADIILSSAWLMISYGENVLLKSLYFFTVTFSCISLRQNETLHSCTF